MTRDEAIEIWKKIRDDKGHPIDVLIELGLLKVDEPKSARDKFIDSMRNRGMFSGERAAALAAYDEAHK